MKAYIIFGIHTAMTGGMLPFTANVESNGLKQNIRETQCQADTQMQSHSAFRFLGRQRHSYQRQDKGGERHGNAFVILYLKFLNIGKAALPLPVDVLA